MDLATECYFARTDIYSTRNDNKGHKKDSVPCALCLMENGTKMYHRQGKLRVLRAAWAPPSPCCGASASCLRTFFGPTSWALECCCFANFQLLGCGLHFVVAFSTLLPFLLLSVTLFPFVWSLPPLFLFIAFFKGHTQGPDADK